MAGGVTRESVLGPDPRGTRKAVWSEMTTVERLLVGAALLIAVCFVGFMGWTNARQATLERKVDGVKTLGDQGRGALCLQLKLQGANTLPAMCSTPDISKWWDPNTQATTAGQERLAQYHQMLCDLEADRGRHPPYCADGG